MNPKDSFGYNGQDSYQFRYLQQQELYQQHAQPDTHYNPSLQLQPNHSTATVIPVFYSTLLFPITNYIPIIHNPYSELAKWQQRPALSLKDIRIIKLDGASCQPLNGVTDAHEEKSPVMKTHVFVNTLYRPENGEHRLDQQNLHEIEVDARNCTDWRKQVKDCLPLEIYPRRIRRRCWTQEENEQLKMLVRQYGTENWQLISDGMKTERNSTQCKRRWSKLDPSISKEKWGKCEDAFIMEEGTTSKGKNNWVLVAQKIRQFTGINRSVEAVASRWKCLEQQLLAKLNREKLEKEAEKNNLVIKIGNTSKNVQAADKEVHAAKFPMFTSSAPTEEEDSTTKEQDQDGLLNTLVDIESEDLLEILKETFSLSNAENSESGSGNGSWN